MGCTSCGANGHNARSCKKRMSPGSTESTTALVVVTPKDNDNLSDITDEQVDVTPLTKKQNVNDPYDSPAKQVQRFAFLTGCQKAQGMTHYNDILYLETSAGKMTTMFLDAGIPAKHLHPCNKDKKQMENLKKKWGVNTHVGDIHDVVKTQTWLGIWFDLEETWMSMLTQKWNMDRVPKFWELGTFVAITLSSRQVVGGTEEHRCMLQDLMDDHGGHSPIKAFACEGICKLNMVFGSAFFCKNYLHQVVQIPIVKFVGFDNPEDYKQVEDGSKIEGVISRIHKGRCYITYRGNNGYSIGTEDPVSFPMEEVIPHIVM